MTTRKHTLSIWLVMFAGIACALLVVGMLLGMFCLVTLFFRHWEQGDRLTFPLQTFVTELTRGDERRGPAILRSGPFWIGFGLCAIFLCLQQLNSRFRLFRKIRFPMWPHSGKKTYWLFMKNPFKARKRSRSPYRPGPRHCYRNRERYLNGDYPICTDCRFQVSLQRSHFSNSKKYS